MKVMDIKIRREIKICFSCGFESVCYLPFNRLLYGRGLLLKRQYYIQSVWVTEFFKNFWTIFTSWKCMRLVFFPEPQATENALPYTIRLLRSKVFDYDWILCSSIGLGSGNVLKCSHSNGAGRALQLDFCTIIVVKENGVPSLRSI